MTLKLDEYTVARGLVEAKRPNTLSEAGVDSTEKLPWDTPSKIPALKVPVGIEGVGDLETWARTTSTSELIQFLTTPSDYSRQYTYTLGNRYVCAWLELQHRVRAYRTELERDRASAERDKKIAEDRAVRAERRARIGTVIAIVSALIAAVSLAFRFAGR